MATDLDVIANLTGAGVTEAQAKTWFTAMRAALAEMGDPLGKYGVNQNLTLSLTVAANALTIALKDRDGSDPSAASPCSIPFRNVTVATGDFTVRNVTAASSLVVSYSSTLGTRNGVPFRLWIVLFDDGGTLRLGVINCLSTVSGGGSGSDVSAIYPLGGWPVASSTAEAGSPSAGSAGTFYTGVAVAAKVYAVLGYATWEAGLAAAGTWSSGPTRVQLFGPGVALPGQRLQLQRVLNATVSTGNTAAVPADDTIPQNTEGNQLMSTVSITPSSTANALAIHHHGQYSNDGAAAPWACSLFQDAVANSLLTTENHESAANFSRSVDLFHCMVAATIASTTFKIRVGNAGNNSFTINGEAGTRLYGGVQTSVLEVEEIMA